MDEIQRSDFRDQVVLAMAHKSWSATKTAEMAKITQTTMTRITRAESVRAESVAKVRQALEIEALTDAQAAAGYSPEIEWVRDIVGMWLRDLSADEREAKIDFLLKMIIKDKRTLAD